MKDRDQFFENSIGVGCGVGGARIGSAVSYLLIQAIEDSIDEVLPVPLRMGFTGIVVMSSIAAGLYVGKTAGSIISQYSEKKEV